MKVGIYAWTSTSARDQNVMNQLLSLREFVRVQEWETYCEYVDQAPVADLAHRFQWRQLLDDVSRRRFDLVMVWRMDRALRSVLDAATTLERFRTWGVG